ncbi:hypothetical protein FX988_03712 [Paraglaciecola mesophila]|uniref:Uncharacterized protein n=1 Tax=Paraglaciecola mesophila TaxID=197222 RepID=A0A857JQU1_9ALTE|nr:hypothetical protein FX988_03712 [Paraglaciecola mesophila]
MKSNSKLIQSVTVTRLYNTPLQLITAGFKRRFVV